MDDARPPLVLVVMKKADAEPFDAATKQLEKSVDALKTFAADHANDLWGRQTAGSFEILVKTLKENKVNAAKTFDPEPYMTSVNQFTVLIEARHRVELTSMRTKALAAASAEAETPAPPNKWSARRGRREPRDPNEASGYRWVARQRSLALRNRQSIQRLVLLSGIVPA